jgi:hypothetical protein
LKRHAQLLVCRSAATTLHECNVNPLSAEHQGSSGRIHRCHGCGTGSIPGCCIFSLLGQPFLQILLRVMRRVRSMWCRGIRANTKHGTLPCRSLLLPQHNWPVAPWIRHRPTEPGIGISLPNSFTLAGSSTHVPAGNGGEEDCISISATAHLESSPQSNWWSAETLQCNL